MEKYLPKSSKSDNNKQNSFYCTVLELLLCNLISAQGTGGKELKLQSIITQQCQILTPACIKQPQTQNLDILNSSSAEKRESSILAISLETHT